MRRFPGVGGARPARARGAPGALPLRARRAPGARPGVKINVILGEFVEKVMTLYNSIGFSIEKL